METLLSEIVNLVPQLALAIVVAYVILKWEDKASKRDEKHLEQYQTLAKDMSDQYKELVKQMTDVVKDNTKALNRICVADEIREAIREGQ